MKRSREVDVVIEYPKVLFIVDDQREGMEDLKALIFQPYLADECGRLLDRVLNEEGEDDIMRRIFISLLFGMTKPEDHKILSQVCLTDTKKNQIGLLEPIALQDMWKVGPIRVEYLKLGFYRPEPIEILDPVPEENETPSSPKPPQLDREQTPERNDIEDDLFSIYPDINYVPPFVIPLTNTPQQHQMKEYYFGPDDKKNSPSPGRSKGDKQRDRRRRKQNHNRKQNEHGCWSYRPEMQNNRSSPEQVQEYKKRTNEIFERHYDRRNCENDGKKGQ